MRRGRDSCDGGERSVSFTGDVFATAMAVDRGVDPARHGVDDQTVAQVVKQDRAAGHPSRGPRHDFAGACPRAVES